MDSLNLHEAATLLGMPDRVVRRWVRQGTIPSGMLNGELIFDQDTLREWAHEHNLVLSGSSGRNAPKEGTHLYQAMKQGGVCYGIPGTDVESSLKGLVERAPLAGEIDRATLLSKLMEREHLASTGMGRGIAIPHPRSPIEGAPPDPMIVTGFLEQPIEYNSIDGEPVFVLFLMLSPAPKIHLQLLSRLGYCLRDDGFVSLLRSCPNTEDLLQRVREMEDALDAGKRV